MRNKKYILTDNDCLYAISKEELLKRFKTFSWFKDEEREKLCETFRQRSLNDDPYDFDDFV